MIPGDEIVPDANMVFDHAMVLSGTPEAIWPWLLQLGKGRAGWYLPGRVERLLPARNRALREIDGRLAQLSVGERIPDYGGTDEWLEVAELQPPSTLIFRSERNGRPFSWALLLTAADGGRTHVRLRFRGRLQSRGVKLRAISAGGGFFDWSTGQLMLRGLDERLRSSR